MPYFGVGLLYSFTQPSDTGAAIYLIGFTTARVLHSVFYVLQMQPYRTIAFGVAQLLLLSMMVHTLVALF